jgi:hypothetical protein
VFILLLNWMVTLLRSCRCYHVLSRVTFMMYLFEWFKIKISQHGGISPMHKEKMYNKYKLYDINVHYGFMKSQFCSVPKLRMYWVFSSKLKPESLAFLMYIDYKLFSSSETRKPQSLQLRTCFSTSVHLVSWK